MVLPEYFSIAKPCDSDDLKSIRGEVEAHL